MNQLCEWCGKVEPREPQGVSWIYGCSNKAKCVGHHIICYACLGDGSSMVRAGLSGRCAMSLTETEHILLVLAT